MGGGNYHRDADDARRSLREVRRVENAFTRDARVASQNSAGLHPDLDILGKIRESRNSAEHPQSTPIAVVMDVTKSRGDDAKRIFEVVPKMLGVIKLADIVPDPQICWAGVGDANTDCAPLQIGQFESDQRIDEELKKLYLERGGGGTGEETYELAAYFFARKTQLDATSEGRKGFMFFLGDEAPYSKVLARQVHQIIGDSLKDDIPSKAIFDELQQKFHTFLIYPRQTMEQRLGSIDAEIKDRLEQANGRYQDVDIRASLIWSTRDDLDLHVKTPSGVHIFYGSKRAPCGGELDVDRNVHGETTKPVENTRWAKGTAKVGEYEVWVELYAEHERSRSDDIEFRVELEINGEVQTIEGKASRRDHRVKLPIKTFRYQRPVLVENQDPHVAYRDEVILSKWQSVIPASHILQLQDPQSAVEVMLGAMALQQGTMSLDSFIASMSERGVELEQQIDVRQALEAFAKVGVAQEIGSGIF
jgi:hypothetical protein